MLVNQMLAPAMPLKSILLVLGGGGPAHCRCPMELTSTSTPSQHHQRCFQTLLNSPPPEGGRVSALHIMGYADLAEFEKSLKKERGKLVTFLKF